MISFHLLIKFTNLNIKSSYFYCSFVMHNVHCPMLIFLFSWPSKIVYNTISFAITLVHAFPRQFTIISYIVLIISSILPIFKITRFLVSHAYPNAHICLMLEDTKQTCLFLLIHDTDIFVLYNVYSCRNFFSFFHLSLFPNHLIF